MNTIHFTFLTLICHAAANLNLHKIFKVMGVEIVRFIVA
jgi:hypothetical protein